MTAGTIAEVRGTTSRNGKTYRLIAIKGLSWSDYTFLLTEDGSFEGSVIDRFGRPVDNSVYADPATVRFLRKTLTHVDTSKGWTNFELLFSGVTKDSITVLYREYTSENLARAAYSQNLVYPKDSTTIRYRDIAIKVIEASNERLRFVVQADGLK